MAKNTAQPRASGGTKILFGPPEPEPIEVIRAVADRFRFAAAQVDTTTSTGAIASVFNIDEKARLLAALEQVGIARDDIEYWMRVLVETAVDAGVPKQAVAQSLDVNNATIQRWTAADGRVERPREDPGDPNDLVPLDD